MKDIDRPIESENDIVKCAICDECEIINDDSTSYCDLYYCTRYDKPCICLTYRELNEC